MKKILITGPRGQLGTALNDLLQNEGIVKLSTNVDIADYHLLELEFKDLDFDIIINCAAYTAVDKAETETEKCFSVNSTGVLNLAKLCSIYQKKIIHISTDYVFSGTKNSPLGELEETMPINVYGASKREGELNLINSNCEYFIIRTSWLYSSGHPSFLKTMLNLGSTKAEINVVNDQWGSPTSVKDLAEFILLLINKCDDVKSREIFHFSNEGECTWFDFASAIMEIANLKCIVNGIPSINYPTPAKRPQYSLLSKAKIKTIFQLEIPHWKISLEKAIHAKRV